MNRLQPLESLIEVCVSCGFVCLVPDRCVSHMVAWIAGCYSVGFYGYRRDHYILQITDYGSRARFNDSVVVCHVLSSCGSNRAPNQLFPIEHTVLSIEYTILYIYERVLTIVLLHLLVLLYTRVLYIYI